ncbi:hypothetical protein AAHE18_16G034300 [Arachis hypogaea]
MQKMKGEIEVKKEKNKEIDVKYLHVVVSVEGFAANRARKLGRTNQNLRWGWDPVLSLVHLVPRRTTASGILASSAVLLLGEHGCHLRSARARKPYVQCNRHSSSISSIRISISIVRVGVVFFVEIHGSGAARRVVVGVGPCGTESEKRKLFPERRGRR